MQVNGRIGGTQQGENLDLRLMFFKDEADVSPVRLYEYDQVQTTEDGRFSITFTSSLRESLSGDYAQICIRNADKLTWDGGIDICANEVSAATPSRVLGASDGDQVVSCVRKRVERNSNTLQSLFGGGDLSLNFFEYCEREYSQAEYASLLDTTSVESKANDFPSDVNFVTVDGVLQFGGNQLLSIDGNKLSISDGNTIDLPVSVISTPGRLDDSAPELALTENDLLPYLDNTDSQDLSLIGNTLALTNDGTTVNLSSYLDNTDTLNALSCTDTQIARWNNTGSVWECSADNVNDADFSATNEIQDLSLSTNTLSLTSDGTTVDLSGYLDNTDTLAGLSCTDGQVASWNNTGGVWECDSAAVDTDDQTLSIDGSNNLVIVDGNSVSLTAYLDNTDEQDLTLSSNTLAISGDPNTDVDLSGYLDNTDAQALNLATNTLTISGGAGSVNLAGYLDNTDTQDLSLASNTLSLVDGGSVSLAGYLDNTDAQDLTLTTNTLALTGDGTTVDLSSYLDNTDTLNALSCTDTQIARWNNTGSVWECSADNVNDADFSATNEIQDLSLSTNTLSLTSDGTTVDLSGYLDNTDTLAGLSCTDGQVASWNNTGGVWECDSAAVDTDDQTLSIDGSNNLVIVDGNSVSLTAYLDNTDEQDLTLSSNTLAISGDPNTDVDLSGYLDNTDAQALNLATNTLTISGGAGSVNLAGYLDNTDTQDLSLASNTLSLVDGGSVSLAGYLDNTDAQDLTLTTNTLALTGDGTTVDLSSYLDNTDTLNALSCTDTQIARWNNTGSVWECSADNVNDADFSATNEIQDLSLSTNTLSLTSDGTTVDLSGYLDNTDTLAGLSCTDGQVASWNNTGGVWECDSAAVDTDDQTLSIDGSNNLVIVDGNSVSLTAYLDNTDEQDLTLSSNTLAISGDPNTDVDLSGYLDNTDAQALNLATNTLTISGGAGSVNLAGYLDNTDTQDLSLASNTLSLVDGGSVSLAGYLDNTDAQDLTLTTNTLALTGDGTTVDLSSYLDNTDTLNALSCTDTQIARWNNTGSVWECSADNVNDADFSATNEIQDLSLSTNTLSLTSDGTTVDLSGYLDNTDTLAGLSCTDGQVASWNNTGGVWECDSAAVDTDDQTLSIDGSNNLVIVDGNSVSLTAYLDNTDEQDLTLSSNTLAISGDPNTDVDLSGYLDNTDAQALNLATNTLTISGGAGSVNLAGYLDNTDTQDLSLASNTLSLVDGGSVSLAGYLDNTDAQDLTLTTNTLALTGDGTTVDLSSYLDNTDTLNALSCTDTQIARWNNTGSVWECSADNVNDADFSATNEIQDLSLSTNTLSLTSDGTTVDLSGYLDNTDTLAGLSCTDGQVASWNNTGGVWECDSAAVDTDDQTLSIDGSNNLVIVDGNSVSLTAYLDNTDEQDLTLSSNTLAISGDPNTDVDLSGYLDNTDAQALNLATNTLTISGGAGSVNLAGYLDNTDTQDLSLASNTLSLVDGGSVSLAGYLDNTDAQDLTLTTNTLALTGDGTTVDLSSYLDNTDTLNALSCTDTQIARWNNTGSVWECSADNVNDADFSATNEIQDLSLSTNTLSLTSDGTTVDLSGYLDNTDTLAGLSCTDGQVASWNNTGGVWECDSAAVDTDDQTLSIDGSNNLVIVDGNSVSLTAYLDNTDEQDLTLSSNTLAISGDPNTDVDLSGYLDNTDAQALNLATNTLTISGGAGSVNLAGYLDNTDTQDLSLASNTLSLVDGGSVSLAGYLDNTDAQDLTLTTNTLALTGDGTTVDLSSYLDNTDTLNALSCTDTQIARWNNTGSVWECSADNVNDADFSATNEIQDLSLSTNTLSLTSDGTTVDLSGYLDNTDTLAGLSCTDGQVASWNNTGGVWECDSAAVDTDDQTLSIDGSNNLVIVDGNSVSLTAYLDNTDEQDLTLSSNTLAISGDPNTDVDLSGYLDNTDAQALNLATNTLTISGGAGSVNLAGYLDNTDTLLALSCSSGQIAEWSGSAWSCGTDDGLTSEVDGIIGNEVLNVTANGGLTRTGAGTGISPYTVGLRTDCGDGEVLSWNDTGSSWDCRDVSTTVTIGITGRHYAYTDNRWTSWGSANQGVNNENWNANAGTAADPVVSWTNIGMWFPKGTYISKATITGRANNTEVTDVDLDFEFRYLASPAQWETGYDSNAESTRVDLYRGFWWNNTDVGQPSFTGNINDHHKRVFDLGYTTPEDGYLDFAAKPSGTITSTRYFSSTVNIEYQLPEL